ncbi:hypothetical protein [Chitinophaga rhizophila]|uniref:Uncharacterized protein n=1 Tax=Chitinophaga rhizophila TaxID=2866212 RepID=A0ABS7GGK6_9BACT|nr:hypothetical protein [Chitinophaga rhizophila]MBW8685919.1 hypothetical protein [Chitinophaga rhizophila]
MEGFDDPFILKFEYKGKPHILEVRPWVQQYKVAFKVTVEQHEITFEKDDEGQYRAIADANAQAGGKIDPQLLQEIAHKIEEALDV